MNSDSPEGKAAAATFQQGMQRIANTQRDSQDALNVVVHSIYSDSTGHQPAAAPKNSQGSFSNATGHKGGF